MENSLNKALYQSAKDLYESGDMDKDTLERFDALRLSSGNFSCEPLEVEEMSPAEIKKLRSTNFLSQADFALYLHTTIPTIECWEQGKKKPRKAELALLNIVKHKGLKGLSSR